jgi:acetyl esterase/lipase
MRALKFEGFLELQTDHVTNAYARQTPALRFTLASERRNDYSLAAASRLFRRTRQRSAVGERNVNKFWLTLFVFCALPLAGKKPALSHPVLQEHQDPSAEPLTIALWVGEAPGSLGDGDSDRPTLTLYAPSSEHSPSAAVIVFPGGGYGYLATNHEGRQIANWLNAMGITAFVLRYRLGPRYRHPVELGDAQRAIRLVRARAREYRVLPDKIGVMGFSAGGHLASTTATHFDSGNPQASDPIDRTSSRPDFAVLAYPVISFTAEYAHLGSRSNLLGDNPGPQLVRELSSELNVTPQTPPTFLFSSSTDTGVPPENSVAFYLALHKAGVPAELHIFENAPHGVGLDLNDPSVGEWSTLLLHWFRERKLIGN